MRHSAQSTIALATYLTTFGPNSYSSHPIWLSRAAQLEKHARCLALVNATKKSKLPIYFGLQALPAAVVEPDENNCVENHAFALVDSHQSNLTLTYPTGG
jgi:hypothetical protein